MKKKKAGHPVYERKQETMPDYSKLRLPLPLTVRILLEGAFLMAMLDYLFYESYPLLILLLPGSILYLRMRGKELTQKRKQTLNVHFHDALSSLNVSVTAGSSLEGAVRSCRKDLERMYGTEDDLVREFRYMETQMDISVPPEMLFLDLGRRSHLSDLQDFAAVLITARRSGGSLQGILFKTARMMGDKLEAEREIEASLYGRKMEQTIMSLMPAGIILYLKLTSPGFFSDVYGNLPGAVFMTVCLAAYMAAFCLGRKIISIEV